MLNNVNWIVERAPPVDKFVHWTELLFLLFTEIMVKKEVEQEEIQHFIESQKIFVEREKERIAQENEYIKAYLARR